MTLPVFAPRFNPAPALPQFAPAEVVVETLASGGMILRSPIALRQPARCIGLWLERWAALDPARVFLAERRGSGGDEWSSISYAETLRRGLAIAQGLLDRRLSADRPILLLAENGIDHALMMLAAMHVGLPVAPVSTAYALLSRDFAKLRSIVELIQPELVFVDDPSRYAAALEAVDFGGAEIVAGSHARPEFRATSLAQLTQTKPTHAVAEALAGVGPDTVAKILFTSGSTDVPKGVINTHGMLCANQQMMAQLWPFLESEPPVLVDWLPWTHTFGGNFDFNMVLRNGGTLYIDDGKPTPALTARTIANLKSAAPSIAFNVARGYGALLDHLESDAAFNSHFFSRLRVVFYAAAALSQDLWERLEACSLKARGEIVPMLSAWGMTETAPMVTCGHFPTDRACIIGLPAPGNELRLEPDGDRLQMLVRGPSVTPGYWQRPDLTRAAFRDGWFVTGDAGRLADADDPVKGILFDGRIAENFKLSSGTWVNVGVLRVALLAATSPLIDDFVLTGHDRDEIGVIAFPNLVACRRLCPDLGDLSRPEAVAAQGAVRDAIATALAGHNAAAGGSSTRIARAILTVEPLSIDAGEITDKGYINQRAVLRRRADLVARLHAPMPDAAVIRISTPTNPS